MDEVETTSRGGRPGRFRRRAWAWLALVYGGASVAASGGGCFQPEDTFVNFTSATGNFTVGAGGEGGGSTGPGGPITAEEFFEQELKPDFTASCGNDCHGQGSVAFLLSGQEYSTITTYVSTVGVPLILKDPSQSLLLSYPNSDDHSGISWNGLDNLRSRVVDWLELEALNVEEVTILQLGPFKPSGFNVLALDSLGPDFSGVTMTFYSIVHGDPPNALQLTNISIWPPNGFGLRVTNPTFVVETNGVELPDTTFHGEPLVFVAPDQVQVDSGELLLTNWEEGSELLVRFQELERLFADSAGNTFDPCTHVELYAQGVEALPINSQVNNPNGLLYCADQCHGGTNGSSPTTVMHLVDLLGEPDLPRACAVTRPFITPTNADASRIVVVTDPSGGSAHPFKFGGNSTSHAAFRDAMAPWINAEGGDTDEQP